MKKEIIISLLCFVLLIVGCSVPPEPSDVGFDLDIEISKITIYKDSNYLYSTDYQALTFDSLEDIEDIKKKVVELGYYEKEEDVLSYAVFEQVAENFFKWREAQKKSIDRDMAKSEVYPV